MVNQNYLSSQVLKHWSQKKVDEYFMGQVLSKAKQYRGLTNPNPMVACLVVKNFKVLAEGVHKRAGKDHAEADCLKKIKPSACKQATLYVNLEPCSHTNKRTPPCLPLVKSYPFERIVICNLDPNPQVKGKSIWQLRKAGFEVTTGILKQQGLKLNQIFFHHIQNKTPFIELKWSQTIDGKMANLQGRSQWITGEKSRKFNQELRSQHDGIMVGANTINQDNPQLNLRLRKFKNKNFTPIIFSPQLNVNFKQKIFKLHPKIIVITKKQTIPKSVPGNVHFIFFKHQMNLTVWNMVLHQLYVDHQITSFFVEGGPQLLSLLLEYNSFQQLSLFIAPKILGDGKSPNQSPQEKPKAKAQDPLNLYQLNLSVDYTQTFDQDIYISYSNRN